MVFYMPNHNSEVKLQELENSVKSPENLVFSGGGIKGLAYAGAIKAIESLEKDIMIKRYAGASAGAITAALLVIGMKADEIYKQLSEVKFENFLEESNLDIQKLIDNPLILLEPTTAVKVLFNEVIHKGLCDGSYFTNWLIERFKIKGFNEAITYNQLYSKTGKELHITLCNLNYGKTLIANHINTPDMPVILSVRASMSIPLIYWPFEWEGDIYVDGGTMYNYPIDVFDNICKEGQTLGFLLSSKEEIIKPRRKENTSILQHVGCIYDAIMRVDEEHCCRRGNMGDAYRTVFIDTKNIKTFDFGISDDKKKTLYMEGYLATKMYFK